MSSRKPARTTRRLLKVATLGIAGLVAGFLTGCSSSDAAMRFSNVRSSDTLTATRRLENLDYRRTPEFRRAPSPHRQPIAPQRSSSSAYALLGEIDAMGHHYDVRSAGQ
jgi:hypothetical protein